MLLSYSTSSILWICRNLVPDIISLGGSGIPKPKSRSLPVGMCSSEIGRAETVMAVAAIRHSLIKLEVTKLGGRKCRLRVCKRTMMQRVVSHPQRTLVAFGRDLSSKYRIGALQAILEKTLNHQELKTKQKRHCGQNGRSKN